MLISFMEIRYLIDQNVHNPIFWVVPICDYIAERAGYELKIELLSFNNNMGIEFDLLQKYFPQIENTKKHPKLIRCVKKNEFNDAKIILVLAVLVGADLNLSWNSESSLIRIFDGTLDIISEQNVIMKIKSYLESEFCLIPVDK